MASDAQLLQRWRDGDDLAAELLVTRYHPILYRFFRNKVDGEVGDLIQQTFLACTRHAQGVRTSFRAWVLTVARHQLYRDLRQRSKIQAESFDASVHRVIDSGTSPLTGVQRAEQGRVLLAALRHLPVELQTVLELHYWEDLTSPEMAEILDLPQGTVKSRIRRAKESLEALLAQLTREPNLVVTTRAQLDEWARKVRADLDPIG